MGWQDSLAGTKYRKPPQEPMSLVYLHFAAKAEKEGKHDDAQKWMQRAMEEAEKEEGGGPVTEAGADSRYSLDGIQQYALKHSARPGSGNDFPYDRDDRGEINVWEALGEALGLEAAGTPVNLTIANRSGRANNYIKGMMGGHMDPQASGTYGPVADASPTDGEVERAGRGEADVWEALEQFVEEHLAQFRDEEDFVDREVVDLPAEKTWRGLNPPEER